MATITYLAGAQPDDNPFEAYEALPSLSDVLPNEFSSGTYLAPGPVVVTIGDVTWTLSWYNSRLPLEPYNPNPPLYTYTIDSIKIGEKFLIQQSLGYPVADSEVYNTSFGAVLGTTQYSDTLGLFFNYKFEDTIFGNNENNEIITESKYLHWRAIGWASLGVPPAEGNDFIYAGSGDDTLSGGYGQDYFNGQAGFDFYVAGLQKVQTIKYAWVQPFAYLGIYTVLPEDSGIQANLSAEDVDVVAAVLNLPQPDNLHLELFYKEIAYLSELKANSVVDSWQLSDEEADTLRSIEGIRGSSLNDVIVARGTTTEAYDFFALGGVAFGEGGNDVIIATAGTAFMSGGSGHDLIIGADNEEDADGEVVTEANDNANGDSGNDYMFGGSGSDTFWGGEGFDYLDGGKDFDWLFPNGEPSGSYINLSSQLYIWSDLISEISTRIGYDLTFANPMLDTFPAVNAYATMDATGVVDQAYNFEGVIGSSYSEVIISAGLTIDSSNGFGPGSLVYGNGGNDTIFIMPGTAFVSGGSGSDVIVGREGNDLANGDEDDDFLFGGLGADTLWGGAGNDFIDGEGGFDWFNTFNEADSVFINLSDASVWSEDFVNLLPEEILSGRSDLLELFTQFAFYEADTTQELAGTFDYLVNIEGVRGTAFGDFIVAQGMTDEAANGFSSGGLVYGQEGADVLISTSGTAYVSGGADDDLLIGSDDAFHRDFMNGDENDDDILGLGGSDILLGGDGRDTFYYLSAEHAPLVENFEVILDFQRGEDLVDLSALDGNPSLHGNQELLFLGYSDFSGTSGELIAVSYPNGTDIFGDLDGDRSADFAIFFEALSDIDSSDFVGVLPGASISANDVTVDESLAYFELTIQLSSPIQDGLLYLEVAQTYRGEGSLGPMNGSVAAGDIGEWIDNGDDSGGRTLDKAWAVVVFEPGETERVFRISIIDDSVIEPDTELNFEVNVLEGRSTTSTRIIDQIDTISVLIQDDDGASSSGRTKVEFDGALQSSLPQDILGYLEADIKAAAERLYAVSDYIPDLEIKVVDDLFQNSQAIAEADSVYHAESYLYAKKLPGGDGIYQVPIAIYEAIYGQDLNGEEADITIKVQWRDVLSWYDGQGDESNVGARNFDVTTVMTHELMHGLGFGSDGTDFFGNLVQRFGSVGFEDNRLKLNEEYDGSKWVQLTAREDHVVSSLDSINTPNYTLGKNNGPNGEITDLDRLILDVLGYGDVNPYWLMDEKDIEKYQKKEAKGSGADAGALFEDEFFIDADAFESA